MKIITPYVFFSLLILSMSVFGQTSDAAYSYGANMDQPYGALNPSTPPETADYAPLIGECNCKSLTRKSDGTWSKDSVDMVWKFTYFMNGTAVQDETLKADGRHTSSIRQYNADSSRWYVTYFSSSTASPSPPIWSGKKEGDDIVLYKPQQAPNGMEGFYRLTFYDISDKGYNWKGEWVNKDESIEYPTWLIFCKRE